MSSNFVKIFESILDSTVWQQDSDTKVVWITLLAMADQHGEVSASIPGLAHRAHVSLEACEKAIEIFQAPDKYSRTPDNEGRRIESIDGGWEILNYGKYRQLKSEEEQRERHRIRQQRYRDREKRRVTQNVTLCDASSRSVTPNDPIAEGEAEVKTPSTSLRSDGELSPAKQKLKPARKRPEHGPDPRHTPLKEEISLHWHRTNHGTELPWGSRDATTLGRMLDAAPDADIGTLKCWVANRFASETNTADRAFLWVEKLPSYANGPLDRYGRLKSQAGNGKPPEDALEKFQAEVNRIRSGGMQ